VGRFILWKLNDPVGARPYREQATAGSIIEALFDLAVVELFTTKLARGSARHAPHLHAISFELPQAF
jgi:hypothetical protein